MLETDESSGKMTRPKVEATELAPRREIAAWAMFDFANSSYTTVVTTAIFNGYFVGTICQGLTVAEATVRLTTALGLANLLVVLTAPVVGALADARARKRLFLFVATAVCVLATASLSLMHPGQVVLCMALYVVSAFAFGSTEYLIAAFLPELAPRDKMGKISSLGWTLGYIGGLLVLGLCQLYVSHAQSLGQTPAQFVPVTLVAVAVIFALASSPTFLWLKERALPSHANTDFALARRSFAKVFETISSARRYKDLFVFLLALFAFSCGTTTVVALAAVYAGQVMHFSTSETIAMILLVQIAAAGGAFGTGFVQEKLGSVRTLAMALMVWSVAIAMSYFAQDKSIFWMASTMMGIAMGASGTAARALVGQLSPAGQSAEFFGLWGLTVKMAAVIGPVTYGQITSISGGNYRSALLSTLMFFVAGLVITLLVNEKRGQAAIASEG